MSSVASGRMTSDYLQEQLIQENEQMLMQLAVLEPHAANLQQMVDALRAEAVVNREKVLSLERENQCIREESDRLRSIVATRHEEDHRRVGDLVASSKETADQRLKDIEATLQNLMSGVGTLLQRSSQLPHGTNIGGSEVEAVGDNGTRSSNSNSDAVVVSLQAQLSERTQERDAALDRIQLIQAQWEAANSQEKQTSLERMTLQERVQQVLTSSHVTSAAASELVSEIFDIHEKETNEMGNKILIREILRNDDAQRHKQELEDLSYRHSITLGELNAEIARLTHSNNELNTRMDRLLMLQGSNNIQSPLSSSTRGTASTDDGSHSATGHGSPDINGPPSVRRLVRRMTLTRSDTGQLTARTGECPPSPGDSHAATQPQATAVGRSNSVTTPPPAPPPAAMESSPVTVIKCPRCTLDNAIDARRCVACDLYLRARSVQPTMSVSPSPAA